MDETGVVGASPVVRVAIGSGTPAARDCLDAAREAASTTRVAAVGPTGLTALAPLVLATRDGETAFHPNCPPDRAREIASDLDDGGLPTEDTLATVEHDPERDWLPVPEETPFAVGTRRALARCGWAAPTSVADAAHEGFLGATLVGSAIRERVAGTGLRGRGRGDATADEPVVPEWQLAREATGDPVVVVNGNESDPGAEMDRLLCESVPLEVLDGALATAAAVEAETVVVYLAEGSEIAHERIAEAWAHLDAERDVGAEVDVVVGPAEYRAGEPTMALEALEGADRIEARRRPPGPAEYGLYGRPTVVHTPRTVAQVRAAANSPNQFHDEAADPGTRVLTVTGDGVPATTVELATDTSLRRALDAVDHPPMRFACVGGQFGGLTRDLDVPASWAALRGADLGTSGVVELFGEGDCAVATAGHRARTARDTNCGRCVPCREGSQQLTGLLREVYDGTYADAKLRELTRVMAETSLCAFGRDAARPVQTAMAEFEAEFVAHAEGRCPAGACEEVGS